MLRRSAAAVAAISLTVFAHTPTAFAEDVRVFVLAGQSNMVGWGEAQELTPDLASQPDVLYDHFNAASRVGGDYAGSTSTDWEPLAPKGSAGWYGPEITFGATIKSKLGGERAAIVKVSTGGSNIVEHWARGVPADPSYPEKSQLYHALLGSLDSAAYGPATGNALLYPDEPTRLDAALARLASAGHTHQLGCFVWVQGENESGWSAALEYESELTGLIAALREDLGRPDLPVVLGRTAAQTGQAEGGPSPDAYLAAVRAAQEAVAAADPKVDWVDMDDLPGQGDNLHFAGEGYRILGERLANACAPLLEDAPTMTTSSSSSSASSGGGSSASGGGTSSSGGGAGPDDGEDGGGCSVEQSGGGLGAGALVLGAAWLAAMTRRNTARRAGRRGRGGSG